MEPIVLQIAMLPVVILPVLIPVIETRVSPDFRASGETGNRDNQKKRLTEHTPLPPGPDLGPRACLPAARALFLASRLCAAWRVHGLGKLRLRRESPAPVSAGSPR
eukprot:6644809-Heterocapsa_arctica.AAC.1